MKRMSCIKKGKNNVPIYNLINNKSNKKSLEGHVVTEAEKRTTLI